MVDLQIQPFPAHHFRLDGGAIFGVVPKVVWVKDYPVDALNRIALTTRSLLIETCNCRIVVDPGIGDTWDDSFVQRYGIEPPQNCALPCLPASVTDVFLTHLHFDHLGGCVEWEAKNTLRMRFPKARHHIQKAQWEWARKPSPKDRGSYIQEHLDLLEASGLLQLHEGNWQPATGLFAFPVEGHTPAQQLLRIESADKTYLYGGDLFPLAALLKLPWVMAYDLDPLATLQAKEDCLRKHLSHGECLILGHDTTCAGGTLDLSGRYPTLVPDLPTNMWAPNP